MNHYAFLKDDVVPLKDQDALRAFFEPFQTLDTIDQVDLKIGDIVVYAPSHHDVFDNPERYMVDSFFHVLDHAYVFQLRSFDPPRYVDVYGEILNAPAILVCSGLDREFIPLMNLNFALFRYLPPSRYHEFAHFIDDPSILVSFKPVTPDSNSL